ncbi:alpha/beta hydrolase [Bradyrhizobium sp. HKCCYLS2058]|uniref:alpha/beta hydrolase n=1 Tax=Bradyrhizobium TaxID=374 RepID=UPI003EB88200
MQSLLPGERLYVNHQRILFATNRLIVAPPSFTKRGVSLAIDEVFSTSRSPSLAYGWADVGYPDNRNLADQNYYSWPNGPNSFRYFSIERYGFVASRDAARYLGQDQRFPDGERALIYVHGINESFRDGAEGLAQLVVDLEVKGVPLLFSWPADRTPVTVSTAADDAYRATLEMAQSSEPALRQSIDDFLSSDGDHFDLVAHSMGTLLALDVLAQRSPVVNQASQYDPAPNVVLAAPDIGVKYFSKVRERFVRKSRRLTIYCGLDRALMLSYWVNHEERLGFCGTPKQPKDYIEGVEFIRVLGNYRDVFSHSYYRNTPEILSDMKRALFGRALDDMQRVPYREIFLNYR